MLVVDALPLIALGLQLLWTVLHSTLHHQTLYNSTIDFKIKNNSSLGFKHSGLATPKNFGGGLIILLPTLSSKLLTKWQVHFEITQCVLQLRYCLLDGPSPSVRITLWQQGYASQRVWSSTKFVNGEWNHEREWKGWVWTCGWLTEKGSMSYKI